MANRAVNLDDLTPEEQLQLLEDIWDRLSQHPANVPLSDAQRAELDRRLDALEGEGTCFVLSLNVDAGAA